MKIQKLTIIDPVKAFDVEKKFTQVEGLLQRLPIYINNGSPEGVINAPPGSIYLNLEGGMNLTLWVKESGTESIGWISK